MASKDTRTQTDNAEPAVEAALIAECRSGVRAAQQRLYELCQQRVYRLMVRMVGTQDAADVSQQVFLQLFRKVVQFEGNSRFETWLYRLAVNEALQHLRKGQRWRFHALAADPVSRPEHDAARREQREVLEQALSQIDPQLRSIFLLREVEGLSYRAISEALDIPEGTVGSRLNRARRELQKHLASFGWES